MESEDSFSDSDPETVFAHRSKKAESKKVHRYKKNEKVSR